MYIISFYWSLSTIVTVGYGDITAGNTIERIYSILLMAVGVVSVSFAIGSITNIVAKIDDKNAHVHQKLQVLLDIKKMYGLDEKLYDQVKKVTKFHFSQ